MARCSQAVDNLNNFWKISELAVSSAISCKKLPLNSVTDLQNCSPDRISLRLFMKPALLLIIALFFVGCATQDDSDPAQAGSNPKEQKKEAREREEFAKTLPPPR